MIASFPLLRASTVPPPLDRKSTRLNSSHSQISYAVFCLKKNNSIWRLAARAVIAATDEASVDTGNLALPSRRTSAARQECQTAYRWQHALHSHHLLPRG